MESIDDIYAGDWIKASDLKEEVTVEITGVKIAKIDEDTKKLVVSFKDFKKSLVLNKTNAKKIAEISGTKDYTKWAGIQIKLIKTLVEYKGEEVDAIRVRSVAPVEKV